MMKYIHVRHLDYWYAVYNIGEFKYVNGVEFSITNDEQGTVRFFHLDLVNLPCLKSMIADGSFVGKDDLEYNLFLEQYSALTNRQKDFFIGSIYYDDQFGDGYSYRLLKNCELNGESIFEIRNKNNKQPNYAVVFINELKDLIPQRVIQWTELLSAKLFLEEYHVQFAKIPPKKEILDDYKAHEHIINKIMRPK